MQTQAIKPSQQIKQMINGLRLSEIHEVSLNHLNHYRRITSVESSDFSRLSHLDTSFVKIVQNRKINHQRWKKFQQNKLNIDLQKTNTHYYNKINQIRSGTSRYSTSSQTSPRSTKPASFYFRKKEMILINNKNPEIARKIINAKGSFDRSKTDMEYHRYRDTVHRLQRFSVYQRVNARQERRFRLKSLTTSNTMKVQNISSVPKRWQTQPKSPKWLSKR